MRRSPRDETPHARNQFVRVERLDDEVVRAEQEVGDAVERLRSTPDAKKIVSPS